MSGLADQLKETLGRPEGEALRTLDLMSLPSSVRRVVNLMLRRVKISYPDLCQAVADLPENKRLSQAELDEILDALCQVGWLEQEQGGGVVAYKVSLGPKPGTVSVDSPLDVLEKGGGASIPPPEVAVSNVANEASQPSRGFMERLKGLFGSPKNPK